MRKIIDIHSHMLPDVDDGCTSIDEAQDMLEIYEEQEVEAVICTPHFGPCGYPGADPEGAMAKLKRMKSPVKLYLGNEILCTGITLEDVREGRARTLAGSKHILIEFEDWTYNTSAEVIVRAMLALQDSEFIPILAHPERYKTLQTNREFYDILANLGVELQINAYDIYQNKNDMTKSATQYILEHRFATYIGSDAHGAGKRPPELSSGVKWIYDHCPEEYADAIVHDNAAKIIGGA